MLDARGVSVAHHAQAVSALRFLCERVLGDVLLAAAAPRPRRERRLPNVLSAEEVRRLISVIGFPKHRAAVAILYGAGLRVSEAVRLRPGDLDPERGLLLVRGGKGRKDRYTLYGEATHRIIETYVAAERPARWLFPAHARTGT